MAQRNLGAWGYNESVDKSSNYTVTADDSGLVLNATASLTFTLPSTVVGYTPIIRVGADGITVAVSPAAADYIGGAGLTKVDNKDLIFTNAPTGSYVRLVGDGANGWYILHLDAGGQSSTVTKEA